MTARLSRGGIDFGGGDQAHPLGEVAGVPTNAYQRR